MATRKPRRKREANDPQRGPLPKDDRLICDLSVALQAAWDMSQRTAIDLALILVEGVQVEPTKQPRGTKHKPGTLVGFRLAPHATFRGRSSTIRRKLRKLPGANLAKTLALALLLQSISRKSPGDKT